MHFSIIIFIFYFHTLLHMFTVVLKRIVSINTLKEKLTIKMLLNTSMTLC